MKKICFLLLLLIALWGSAAVAETDDFLQALFLADYPGYELTAFSRCDPTAAAVLSKGNQHVLCMAENVGGQWAVVVSNPDALRTGRAPSLLLDTDNALFWTYHTGLLNTTYHAVREQGEWRFSNLTIQENHENGNVTEHHLMYRDGLLCYQTAFCDENDNLLSSRQYTPAPAAWLSEQIPLKNYHDALLPKPDIYYTHSWLSSEATALAAEELLPDYRYLDGCAEVDHIGLFLESPDGKLLFASCRYRTETGWQITLSTPLPEGTTYGIENFSASLVIGDLLVNIAPVSETACGVSYIVGNDWISLGENRLAIDVSNGYENYYGNHPWDDITTIDWTTLPHTFEEALASLDVSGWAIVNNPNPADRLHLRQKPERSSHSLGKYYNGTPVRILETQNGWAHVNIYGVEGWMMQDYLATGSAMNTVIAAFPARIPAAGLPAYHVYASPKDIQPLFTVRDEQEFLLVLGIAGEEWYHVWFPHANRTGYVPQSDWWEGNG